MQQYCMDKKKKTREKHALIVMVCGSSGLTEAINILDALF